MLGVACASWPSQAFAVEPTLAVPVAAPPSAPVEPVPALLQEASRVEFVTAQSCLERGAWSEAVLRFARALRYHPGNTNAQDALWLTLRYGTRDASPLPFATLPGLTSLDHVYFTADGTRALTVSGSRAQLRDTRIWRALGAPMAHEGLIRTAALSLDGTRVFTASTDGTARLWDGKTGAPLGAVLKPEGGVHSVDFSADGALVVTADDDSTARVWDALTGKPTGIQMRTVGHLMNIKMAARGDRLFTLTSQGVVRTWNVRTGEPLGPEFRTEVWCRLVALPEGIRVLAKNERWELVIFNPETGERLGTKIPCGDSFGLGPTFSPDGTRLLVPVSHTVARVWDVATGQPIGEEIRHQHWILDDSFTRDGTRIATAGGDGLVRLWDAATGRPLAPDRFDVPEVQRVWFAPDGHQVLASGFERPVQVWNTQTPPLLGLVFAHEAGDLSAALAPAGGRLLTGGRDGFARQWDLATGQLVFPVLRHESAVKLCRFSLDGTRLLTVESARGVRIWDAKTGKPLGEPLPQTEQVDQLCLTPDGRLLLTLGLDQPVRVWDLATGQPTGVVLTYEDRLTSVELSADGTRVLTASERTAQVADVKTGKLLGSPMLHGDRLASAAFSPDGTRIVTACEDGTLQLWDAATGQRLAPKFRDRHEALFARYSPDGTRILVTVTSGAWILDATTLQPIGRRLTFRNFLRDAMFSPDGTRILTTSGPVMRLWDGHTGQPIGPEFLHHEDIHEASFHLDGRQVVTASQDGVATVWSIRPAQPISPEAAEWLAILCTGWRWDPLLGDRLPCLAIERHAAWSRLDAALGTLSPAERDWRLLARLELPFDPVGQPYSTASSLTLREACTRLLSTRTAATIEQVRALDPGHPLLPLCLSSAAWSRWADRADAPPSSLLQAVQTAMSQLSATAETLTASELRTAARYLDALEQSGLPETSLPRSRVLALRLLDRAKALEPEDEATTALRLRLNQ